MTKGERIAAALRGRAQSPEHVAARVQGMAEARRERTRRRRHVAMLGNKNGVGNTNVVTAAVIGECVYCGAPAQTRDHVVPLSRGGPDEAANIVPCCFWCNRSKANRTPDEWIAGVPKTSCTGPWEA